MVAEHKPLVLPPRTPRVDPELFMDPEQSTMIDDDLLGIIVNNLAKASTFRERKQHIAPLTKYQITFEHLGKLVHRIPSLEERAKILLMLQPSVFDSEHSFFLFSQGFATQGEREYVSDLFGIPLTPIDEDTK